jgi:hypothetical protein
MPTPLMKHFKKILAEAPGGEGCAVSPGSGMASEWAAVRSAKIRLLSDVDFERAISARSSAYKAYPTKEDGSTDFSRMTACILRFEGGEDELLIRASCFPNAVVSNTGANTKT